MTNEEFDRRMEFFLHNQAQFDADMRRLEAAQAETQKLVNRTAETVSSLTAVTFEGFKILSEAQRLTEEQLQKLMAKFDRHISEDHNGLEN